MKRRHIEIPAPVPVPGQCGACRGTGKGDAKPEIPFDVFLMLALDAGADTKGGLSQIRKLDRIAQKIEDAKGELILDESEWDLVKRTVEHFNWNPGLARRCIAFFVALEEAVSFNAEDKEEE